MALVCFQFSMKMFMLLDDTEDKVKQAYTEVEDMLVLNIFILPHDMTVILTNKSVSMKLTTRGQ